jgi:hypothetical protein
MTSAKLQVVRIERKPAHRIEVKEAKMLTYSITFLTFVTKHQFCNLLTYMLDTFLQCVGHH